MTHYQAVQQYLQASGFTEEFLLRHFSLPRLHLLFYPLGIQGERFAQQYQGPGTPLFLARVFIGGYAEPPQEFLAHMPGDVFHSLASLGLLEKTGDEWQATGLLFPYAGFFVTADRAYRGQERMPPNGDYVAGGVDPTSVQFYEGLSTTPCRTLLEMGTGSGVGALLATRFAEKVWAVDINSRSVEFAGHNRNLNGLDNLTVLQSDLFSALENLRFERIIANLPFVPSTDSTAVFAAGGEDGERILAAFLSQCAAHLEPGGRVYALVMGSDRTADPFESRIRRYLAAAEPECDVALFPRKSMAPMDFAFDQLLLKNSDSATVYRWVDLFERFAVEQMVLATLVVQRRSTDRAVFTVRHQLSPTAAIEDIDRAVNWETQCLSADFVPSVLPATPRPTTNWEALSKHVMEAGEMKTASYSIIASHPFQETLECAPWVVTMASKANGELTTSQLLGMMQKQTGKPGETLLRVFSQLVGAGVLEIG